MLWIPELFSRNHILSHRAPPDPSVPTFRTISLIVLSLLHVFPYPSTLITLLVFEQATSRDLSGSMHHIFL